MPPKKRQSTEGGGNAKKPKVTDDTFKSAADENHDTHTSRSEAKKAKLNVQAADMNDDGRVTRSEARLAMATAKKSGSASAPVFLSLDDIPKKKRASKGAKKK
eukprot:m.331875 g.331875  ORF g.331875 m.331875 type:complete len:103 (+) comp16806_c0_seq1:959-1267(+)